MRTLWVTLFCVRVQSESVGQVVLGGVSSSFVISVARVVRHVTCHDHSQVSHTGRHAIVASVTELVQEA